MRVDPNDLVRSFGGQGAPFENFVFALIHEAARECGIAADAIRWDPRSNAPDGGRDIVVRQGNPRGPGHFIPTRPSVWSMKSGDDGVRRVALRHEILAPPPGSTRPDHREVRAALARGDVYVWCAVHPISIAGSEGMEEEAALVAAELGADASQFAFRWQDQLAVAAERYPNVIPPHLQAVVTRWAGVRYLREWEREANLGNAWVDFGGRAGIVDRIQNHLLGRESPNVLHVAGLSGVGKTRAAFEACRRAERLHGVFYLPHFTDLTLDLRRAIDATDAVSLVLQP